MKKMTSIVVVMIAAACMAAGEFVESTRVAYFNHLNRYVLVAPYSPRCFLQLRAFEHDRIVDDVVLSSRYMDPVQDFRNVVLDDAPEILVKVRDGGTGLATTRLLVILVTASNLVEIGDFPVDHFSSYGDPPQEDSIQATVTFATNGLTYAYTRETVDGTNTTSTTGADRYRFDEKKLKYMKENPQQDESTVPAKAAPSASSTVR